MIQTPIGIIRVFADEKELAYSEMVSVQDVLLYNGERVDGRFRITVPARDFLRVWCVLETTLTPAVDTGEGYFALRFERDALCLFLGGEDESDAFLTLQKGTGIEYRLSAPTETLTFGIAWTLETTEGDVRAWLAADPTLGG